MTCRPPDGVGPHGPTPCGPMIREIQGEQVPFNDECACGCTAYEEACTWYGAWLKAQQVEDLERVLTNTRLLAAQGQREYRKALLALYAICRNNFLHYLTPEEHIPIIERAQAAERAEAREQA